MGSAISVGAEAICRSTALKEANADKGSPSVKNCLLQRIFFWERILHAPAYILSIIKNGYAIPFSTEPPPAYSKNNRSSLNHPDFVESEIANCVDKQNVRN